MNSLPWYDPKALPRFEGCPHHCRDKNCKDTNWGGHDRVHGRSSNGPPFRKTLTPCPEKCPPGTNPLPEPVVAEPIAVEQGQRTPSRS